MQEYRTVISVIVLRAELAGMAELAHSLNVTFLVTETEMKTAEEHSETLSTE